MSDSDAPDLRPIYPEESPYRVRLPGSIAKALGWSRELDKFGCYGVFRTDGELLCAAASIATSAGEHPFRRALDFRETRSVDPITVRLEGMPSTATLAIDLRVFDFDAKWTDKKRSQLDLKLGITITSLLGWRDGESPPIYPRLVGAVLCLISLDKVRSVQRQGASDFSP